MNAEPELDQLSAYVDQELTGTARQELEEHLKGCETCRRRLEALRQTINAIRALPQETPPRTFTIPAQRRQSFRWLPTLAWAGGAAAAALIVVSVGISLSHFPGGGKATSGAATPDKGNAYLFQQRGPAASSGPDDRTSKAFAAAVNVVTVTDSRNPSRMLTLSTDSRNYKASNGSMEVRLDLAGVPAGASLDRQVRLILSRGALGVELPSRSWGADPALGRATTLGRYDLASLPLPEPRAGTYRLIAIWTDRSGATLTAELPIELN
jgi:hypothetical protein